MASNVTKVTVISGWNGWYGSMGPKGHVRGLDLVMRVLTVGVTTVNFLSSGGVVPAIYAFFV